MKAVPLRRYVITAYLTFWVMVLGLCGTASMVFHAPPLVMRILADVCAWSPTIVLFCMWNQLRPAQTRRAFVASCFSGRITWYVPLLLAVIVSGGVLVSVSVLSVLEHRAFMSYVSTGGWSLPASILLSVFSGPTGEELGWRGMLFPLLCKRMSQRAAVLVSGVIWGLWHAPVIAMGHNYGMGYPGFPIAGILMMVLACIAMGSIMSYLRLRTGSVWPCALAHGAVNATASIGVLFCTAGFTLLGPNMLGLLAGLPMIAVGIVCWLRMPIADQGDA